MKIAVVGDVAVDWFEEVVRSTNLPGPPEKIANHLLQTGFTWHGQRGGAWLLADLVKCAVATRHPTATVVGHPSIAPTASEAPEFVNSLATLGLSGTQENARLRVARSRGFMPPRGRERARLADWPNIEAADVVVVDDAGNGVRWDTQFAQNVENLLHTARLFVVKLSRPLDHSPFVDLIDRFEGTSILVINADDLRAQDVDISRRLSWERTASDLAIAAESETVLAHLRRKAEVLVRLGSDGLVAFLRSNERPLLVYDPVETEGGFTARLAGSMPCGTSAFTATLVAEALGTLDAWSAERALNILTTALDVVRSFHERGFDRRGSTLEYPVDALERRNPDQTPFATATVRSDSNWSILDERLADDEASGERAFCDTIVVEGRTRGLSDVPKARYGKLLLVDRREIEGYRSIENLLREYCLNHGSATKPLSFSVFGPPGSGKSFGVKQLSTRISNFDIVIETFNLTQFDDPADLSAAFHFARDVTLRGKIPMLIFDEFDCNLGSAEFGWLKYFLAPMQDGEFKDGGRPHPIGPAIFVFAGGVCETFEQLRGLDKPSAKVRDFVSRLRGHLNVLGVNPQPGGPDPAFRARRAVLLRALLLGDLARTGAMFPRIENRRLFQIDTPVLKAFLDAERFEHGARSLEAVLAMSELSGRERFTVSALPSDDLLSEHTDPSFADILRRRQ